MLPSSRRSNECLVALSSVGRITEQTPREALARGAAFLTSMQTESGDWPQQHISGVLNRNSMITYANYRNIFPLWALGLYRRHVLLGEALPL